jgi:hypothetical protein
MVAQADTTKTVSGTAGPTNVVSSGSQSDGSSKHQIVIQTFQEVPQKQQPLYENYQFWLPIVTVILSVSAAHFLTRQRDRDRDILDLLASLEEQVSLACTAASSAWTERRGPKRVALVAEVKGRVQLIAGSIDRIKSQSKRYNLIVGPIRILWPYPRFIDASEAMIAFRRAITSDPFDDEHRSINKLQLVQVEEAKLDLLAVLHSKWADWAFGQVKVRAKKGK